MRLFVLCVSALYAVCLAATCAIAQTAPYATHMDRRHGNDHVYPDRGAVVRDVPRRATGISYAGISYRFAAGVWYQRQGPAYIVVTPPIGVIVPRLPAFATSFNSGGKNYLYADDVFYSPRPDLGGYEVVNDPEDDAPEQPPEPPAVLPAVAQPPAESPGQPENVAAATAAPVTPSDSPGASNPTGIAISPRNGQSEDQQAIDRYGCYQFAVAQTGFDPLAMNSGAPPDQVARLDSDYARAQAACLEGRGYTVP